MLSGEKVKLVCLEGEDLTSSLGWANNTWLNSRLLRVLPVTRMEEEEWYERLVRDTSKMVFAIKTISDEKHVGNTGFYDIDWVHRRAEFWIILGDENFRGKGIGMEVVALMKEFGFKGLNLARLYLHVGENNQEAIRLYEKSGFSREGLLRNHAFIEGEYVNVIVMGLLRKDF